MKRLLNTGSILLLLCAASAHAQLYKSVGPDGRVTYSDTPPASAKAETRPLASKGASTAGLPFELAEAVRANPVVLYTGADCAPCTAARQMLTRRGIPFTEKTITTQEDIALLKAAGGDNGLPQLTVGRKRESGFEEGAWNASLSAAGYPVSSQLPSGYRNPAPQALAAKEPQVAARQEQRRNAEPSAPAATALPPAAGNAPPGFRF